MQTQRVVRRLFTALVAVVMGGTTAFAQNIPFDITDPTPRDVLIDVEAYNTISVVDGVVGNGGGADPVTLQPNPIAVFGNFDLIRGNWTVSGNTGTIAISTAEMEGFVNSKFSSAFIFAVPGTFVASEITVDIPTGEASWSVIGEVTNFGNTAPFGSLAQTAAGPYTFDDPVFVGSDFEGDVVPGTTTGIDVRAPGVANFCTESFNNHGSLTECGGSGSLAFGYGESYPYIPAYGLVRMTGPVGVSGAGIYNGFFAFDLGDQKWSETCGDGIVDPGEECDDGNGEDGDCCTAQCTLEPVGSPCDGTGTICTSGECDAVGNCNDVAAPDGTVCSDNDTCTVGDECLSGACESGPREPADCGDSKLCYKAKTSKNTPKFAATTVTVDAVESASYNLAKPLELCAPADDDDSGAVVADAFALSYKLKRSSGQAKHQSIAGIQVDDQLGSISVDTIKEDRLFVPSGYALDAAATELPAGTADHFLCYKVKISKGTPKFPRGVQVTLDVGSTSNRVFDVKKPTKLCFVADKNSEGVSNQNQNLMCYLVKKARGEEKYERVTNQIHTADQFGDLRFDTITERELCIPAEVQLP